MAVILFGSTISPSHQLTQLQLLSSFLLSLSLSYLIKHKKACYSSLFYRARKYHLPSPYIRVCVLLPAPPPPISSQHCQKYLPPSVLKDDVVTDLTRLVVATVGISDLTEGGTCRISSRTISAKSQGFFLAYDGE